VPPPQPPPQWAPAPQPRPAKKSNAIWWILGGFITVLIIGGGFLVLLIVLASLGDSSSNNSNAIANENRNANVSVNTIVSNTNANVGRPSSLADDFSQQKWGVGNSQYGRIWYEGDEYHMVSRERTFVVMYAPSDDYSTENATVKVTARSVAGSVPSAGFGLMVHCTQSKNRQLEDYGLLIYPAEEPEYEVIMHKEGNQSSLVPRTKSNAIRSGSNPNVLEVRTSGSELSFYTNGQFLTTITDRENFRRGRTGFYTSDIHEVAFDDLVIQRSSR
jgi:uncharacterized protein YlbG (UPF0298 family)